MDPLWHYMAWLLAFARLSPSNRTLSVLSWKVLGFGVSVAVLFASYAYAFGWRVRDLNADPSAAPSASASLPPTASAARTGRRPIPTLAATGEAACYASLNEAGVSFQKLPKDQALGVAWPINLTSAVDGVVIHGAKKNAATNYLDCRLALALLAWAPSLREQGVVGLAHLSAYRRDAVVAASKKQSGHALGFALDVARFEMRDGRELGVLEDWVNRSRGADPCQKWPTDQDAARIMRKLVCDAYEHDLFQSVVTPHANDAHFNHVHLEIRRKDEGAWME
jgi:hypothetical protein